MKNPFRYGCVVEGEYFCPRPDLERQIRRCAEDGHEMLRIFTSPDSPFFKSAALFSIGEIDTEEFARFVVARFRKGGRKVGLEMAKTIISFARGVSGDVQELCDALWSVTDESEEIVEADIAAALGIVFSREKNGFDAIVADLTPNQFTVLRGLAENEDSRVFTAKFMNRVRMTSPGSVKRVLNKLVALRVIYLYRSQYKFANPFFREWLRRELR